MDGVLTRLIGIIGGGIAIAAMSLYGIVTAAAVIKSTANGAVGGVVGLVTVLALLFGVGVVAAKIGH